MTHDPVQAPGQGARPVEADPAETNPAETNPAGADPAGADPAEGAAAGAPAEADPAGGVPAQPGTSQTAPRSDGLPSRTAPATPDERPAIELARRIVELAEEKKAADIVVLELAPLTTVADYFVICSGGSERQLGAIADGILEGLRGLKVRPIGREGMAASHWILLDFGAVVVHVFTPPERDYYGIEKHWSEARTILQVQ